VLALPPRPPRDTRRVIALDAGHGGVDPGAISAITGQQEKAITLAVTRDVRDALQATGRFRVVMTRDSDVFVRLRDRVEIARRAGADLFVSIHADSLQGDQRVTGLSVYTLSEQASDREAEALAQRENRSDRIGGVDIGGASGDLRSILIDLAQRDTLNASARFAQTLVRQMRAADVPTLPQPHRFAGLAVLTAPDVPSVLVELGYLSNREDAKRLADPAQRLRLATGIATSIDRYFDGATAIARR
jgi:N-acetylmuramoyl-L-alanine amidase